MNSAKSPSSISPSQQLSKSVLKTQPRQTIPTYQQTSSLEISPLYPPPLELLSSSNRNHLTVPREGTPPDEFTNFTGGIPQLPFQISPRTIWNLPAVDSEPPENWLPSHQFFDKQAPACQFPTPAQPSVRPPGPCQNGCCHRQNAYPAFYPARATAVRGVLLFPDLSRSKGPLYPGCQKDKPILSRAQISSGNRPRRRSPRVQKRSNRNCRSKEGILSTPTRRTIPATHGIYSPWTPLLLQGPSLWPINRSLAVPQRGQGSHQITSFQVSGESNFIPGRFHSLQSSPGLSSVYLPILYAQQGKVSKTDNLPQSSGRDHRYSGDDVWVTPRNREIIQTPYPKTALQETLEDQGDLQNPWKTHLVADGFLQIRPGTLPHPMCCGSEEATNPIFQAISTGSGLPPEPSGTGVALPYSGSQANNTLLHRRFRLGPRYLFPGTGHPQKNPTTPGPTRENTHKPEGAVGNPFDLYRVQPSYLQLNVSRIHRLPGVFPSTQKANVTERRPSPATTKDRSVSHRLGLLDLTDLDKIRTKLRSRLPVSELRNSFRDGQTEIDRIKQHPADLLDDEMFDSGLELIMSPVGQLPVSASRLLARFDRQIHRRQVGLLQKVLRAPSSTNKSVANSTLETLARAWRKIALEVLPELIKVGVIKRSDVDSPDPTTQFEWVYSVLCYLAVVQNYSSVDRFLSASLRIMGDKSKLNVKQVRYLWDFCNEVGSEKPLKQAAPILFDDLITASPKLTPLEQAVACIVLTFGMRGSTLSRCTEENLNVTPGSINFFPLRIKKADRHRRWVVLSSRDHLLYPSAALFQKAYNCVASRCRIRKHSKPLFPDFPYRRVNALAKKIQSLVPRLRSLLISSHSFRSGMATSLYLRGISDAYIKARGRWASDEVERYLRTHIGPDGRMGSQS